MSMVSGKTLPAPFNAVQGSDTIDMAAWSLLIANEAVWSTNERIINH